MLRKATLCVMATMIILGSAGCRICADCEDMDYPAYGGAWQRTVRDSGRVASLFDPGGAKAGALVGRETPEGLERRDPDSAQPSDEDDSIGSEEDDSEETKDRPSMDDFDDLDEGDLEDMEDDRSNKLKDLELDDIEVQIPGNLPPVAMR